MMCERRPVEKTIELLVLVLAIKIGHLSLALKFSRHNVLEAFVALISF